MSQIEETIEKLVKRVERLEQHNDYLRTCIFMLSQTDLTKREYFKCLTAYTNMLASMYKDLDIPDGGRKEYTRTQCLVHGESSFDWQRQHIDNR